MQNPKQQPSGFVGAFCSSFMWLVSVSVAGVVLMGLLSFLHAMAVFDVVLVIDPALPLLLPPVMALRNPNPAPAGNSSVSWRAWPRGCWLRACFFSGSGARECLEPPQAPGPRMN